MAGWINFYYRIAHFSFDGWHQFQCVCPFCLYSSFHSHNVSFFQFQQILSNSLSAKSKQNKTVRPLWKLTASFFWAKSWLGILLALSSINTLDWEKKWFSQIQVITDAIILCFEGQFCQLIQKQSFCKSILSDCFSKTAIKLIRLRING